MSTIIQPEGVTLKPGEVVWCRNPNLEFKLNQFGVKWEWRDRIKLDTILFDRNPSRLTAKTNSAQTEDLEFKIQDHGQFLPGVLLSERPTGKQACIGGFHRSEACDECGITYVSGYVVFGVGPQTEHELAIADNTFDGTAVTVPGRLEQAIASIHKLQAAGVTPDLPRLATRLDLPLKRLERVLVITDFKAKMTQPDTLVIGGEKLTDSVVEVLAANAKHVNEPVLIEAARCLARFKEASGNMATDLLKQVKGVTPKTENAQRAKIAEIEREMLKVLELRKAEKNKPARGVHTTDTVIVADMSRLLTGSKALEGPDLLDLFQGEKREQFIKFAKQIKDRLNKALKALKDTE